VRRYLLRQVNLSTVSQDEINDIAEERHNRPRRCLGIRTPNEVLSFRD
jgi:IS30 family transposase